MTRTSPSDFLVSNPIHSLWVGDHTPLQRSSWCILQPKPTEQQLSVKLFDRYYAEYCGNVNLDDLESNLCVCVCVCIPSFFSSVDITQTIHILAQSAVLDIPIFCTHVLESIIWFFFFLFCTCLNGLPPPPLQSGWHVSGNKKREITANCRIIKCIKRWHKV